MIRDSESKLIRFYVRFQSIAIMDAKQRAQSDPVELPEF
jgi:hypothetical protein